MYSPRQLADSCTTVLGSGWIDASQSLRVIVTVGTCPWIHQHQSRPRRLDLDQRSLSTAVPCARGNPPLLPPCSNHVFGGLEPFGTVATVRKPAGCCIRPPLDPIGIRPPLVRSLLPFPPYPSLAMLSCLGSGIGGTFSHAFRSLLRPGSLPIDRDRLAGLGVAIWGVGAFSTYSRVLRE